VSPLALLRRFATVLRLLVARHVASRPMRTALTALGIALGVALYLAIDVINGSTLGFFRDSVASIAGKAKLTVSAGEAGFPEEKLGVVQAVPGVKSAVPSVEAKATFGTGADRTTLVVLGIDFLTESAVRSYETDGEDLLDDPLTFLNQADSIVVTRAFAAAHGLHDESPLPLTTALGARTFTVRGQLSPTGAAKAFGGGVAVMDIDGARVMFGKEGRTDRIDVVPAEGADEAALARAIAAALGPGYRVERPDEQSETFARMVAGYQGLLSFLGSLGLLVGLFLVANTMGMSVAERRREIGVLRAVGASRGTVLTGFLAEAAALGLAGGASGAALGRAAASWLVGLVSRSMQAQFVTPIDVATIAVSRGQLARAVALGVVAALVAAFWPAYQATRVDGLEALRPADAAAVTARGIATARWARGAGVAMLAYLGVVATRVVGDAAPGARMGMPLAAALGTALAAPWLVTALLRGLRAVLARPALAGRGFVLRLACDNLLRHPKRTGSQVLALMVGLSLVIVIATVHASFEATIGGWIGRALRSDVLVSSTGRLFSLEVEPLHEDIAQELDRVPGVDRRDGRGARGFRYVRIQHGGKTVGLKAWDEPDPSLEGSMFDVTSGAISPAEAARALFASPDAAMVSETFAARFHAPAGSAIDLDTPSGRAAFHVVAVVNDFSSPEGVVYLRRDTYKRLWRDPLVTAFAVQAAPGVPPPRVRDAIAATLGETRGLVPTLNAELREQMDATMRESFAYTHAIELAALLVGLLGLLNTVLVSVLERTRELGMLRAVGMSRAQLAAMVLAEAALLGAFGGAVAGVLGAYVSATWLVGSLSALVGWVIHLRIAWGALAATLAAGLGVGLVAGLAGMRRAAAVPIREALARD
jgi:putative ABC transport system permease protein